MLTYLIIKKIINDNKYINKIQFNTIIVSILLSFMALLGDATVVLWIIFIWNA